MAEFAEVNGSAVTQPLIDMSTSFSINEDEADYVTPQTFPDDHNVVAERPFLYYINQHVFKSVNVFICLVGIMGNFTSMVIFKKLGLRDRATATFFALAVSDFCSLAVKLSLPLMIFIGWLWPKIPIDIFQVHVALFPTPWFAFSSISILLTMYLTIKRSLAVLFPLKFKTAFGFKQSVRIIIAIYLAIFALALPAMVTVRLGYRYVPRLNATVLTRLVNDSNTQALKFFYLLTSVGLVFLSEIVVVIATIILWKELRKLAVTRQAMFGELGKSVARDANLLRTIVGVAIVFVICNTPLVAVTPAMVLSPKLKQQQLDNILFETLRNATTLMSMINSCINIFVYYNTNEKFKRIARHLLFCCCFGRENGDEE